MDARRLHGRSGWLVFALGLSSCDRQPGRPRPSYVTEFVAQRSPQQGCHRWQPLGDDSRRLRAQASGCRRLWERSVLGIGYGRVTPRAGGAAMPAAFAGPCRGLVAALPRPCRGRWLQFRQVRYPESDPVRGVRAPAAPLSRCDFLCRRQYACEADAVTLQFRGVVEVDRVRCAQRLVVDTCPDRLADLDA
jgi:hypothetical protein